MTATPATSVTPPAVPSPCVSVCKMNDDRSLCKGCWRTIPEISAWSKSSDAEKLVIWSRVAARVKAAGADPLPNTPANLPVITLTD